MPVEIVNHYTLVLLQQRPDALFVFGDNMARFGFGGQANACRGQPNAVGVPTKWKPSMWNESFFKDEDFQKVKPSIDEAFGKLEEHLRDGGVVILPSGGIGTGLAELPKRAPAIHLYIMERIDRLREIQPSAR
jgi:hypothetical protein